MRRTKRGEPTLTPTEWRISGWGALDAADGITEAIDHALETQAEALRHAAQLPENAAEHIFNSAMATIDALAELASRLRMHANRCESLAARASRRGPKPRPKPPPKTRTGHVNAIMGLLPQERWPKKKPGRSKERRPFSDEEIIAAVASNVARPAVDVFREMVATYSSEVGGHRMGVSQGELVRYMQRRLSELRAKLIRKPTE
jgi:hypothetical protein